MHLMQFLINNCKNLPLLQYNDASFGLIKIARSYIIIASFNFPYAFNAVPN